MKQTEEMGHISEWERVIALTPLAWAKLQVDSRPNPFSITPCIMAHAVPHELPVGALEGLVIFVAAPRQRQLRLEVRSHSHALCAHQPDAVASGTTGIVECKPDVRSLVEPIIHGCMVDVEARRK